MTFDWIEKILLQKDLHGMGHGQLPESLNLGLGWLYYALARLVRPARVVCIGSWRGFVPIVLGHALKHNGESGRITFVDPSLVDDFWMEPQRTRAWFESFGLENIEHHCLTTQEFVNTAAYQALGPVGLLFIDGYHTAEQARFDHEAFAGQLTRDSYVFFHDSIRPRLSTMYGEDKHYTHTVRLYINELKRRPELQVIDFPFGAGVSLVRRADVG
jgi:predicted O-methyltransferase YrrM